MCKYCLECDWKASTEDGYSDAEVSKKAIEHFVETGHTVDSFHLPPPAAVIKN
jgi:predicted small metal-binding protein